jgi:hypothetical protein
MVELPENFPEYSIMCKTLSEEIQSKIDNYQLEITKIKKKFPDNFFEELN